MGTRRDKPGFKACQRGLAAVELAIALPLLVMVMLAVGELGRAFYSYNTLQKATHDGLRYLADEARLNTGAIIDVDSPASGAPTTIVNTAKNLIAYGGPAAGTALLPGLAPDDVAFTNAPDAEHVTATVTYAYTPLYFVIPTFGFGDDITVPQTFTVRLTMRVL